MALPDDRKTDPDLSKDSGSYKVQAPSRRIDDDQIEKLCSLVDELNSLVRQSIGATIVAVQESKNDTIAEQRAFSLILATLRERIESLEKWKNDLAVMGIGIILKDGGTKIER